MLALEMRVVDTLALVLLAVAALAFVLGVLWIGERHDLAALASLAVGGLGLRAGTAALRPREDP